MNYEKEEETIIFYNELGENATVYTCNKQLRKKLQQMEKKYPSQFTLIGETAMAVTYEIPKNAVRIHFPYHKHTKKEI